MLNLFKEIFQINLPIQSMPNPPATFPNYQIYLNSHNIKSSIQNRWFDDELKKINKKNPNKDLLKLLIQHSKQKECENKFFKDKSTNEDEIYRFKNIKSASSTVIDDPIYFPLRINRLVVSNYQVGLSLSSPKLSRLPAYFLFLFEKKIPAVHILLHSKDYLTENDMPKYHEPFIENTLNPCFRVAKMNHRPSKMIKNTLYIPSLGINTCKGKMKIFFTKIMALNKNKTTETHCYNLTLQMKNEKHQLQVLHSKNWQDQTALSYKEINELLAIRNQLFVNIQRSHIITHCKAGVGRTGTLLAAEAMSKLHSSFLDTVVDLRDSRNNKMIQTKMQLKGLINWCNKHNYPLLNKVKSPISKIIQPEY